MVEDRSIGPAVLTVVLAGAMTLFAAPSGASERIEIPLVVKEAPKDLWSKKRIVARLVDGAVVLKDEASGPFNDASFWQIALPAELPYGRKELLFSVSLGQSHIPLWGTSLLQPIVDGKEASPALGTDGRPSFEKIVAPDGKGFVPARSGPVALSLDRADTRLTSFAFMTAGAEGLDMTLSDFKVVAWPEEDTRVFEQQPRVSTLGFPRGDAVAIVEWYGDVDAASATVSIGAKGGERTKRVEVSLPRVASAASGSLAGRVDLSALAPGRYEIEAPALGGRSAAGSATFEIVADASALVEMRDRAWGAFYYITDDENGPYPDAHRQDEAARIYGAEGTQDVRGGWFDAGDYGKYAVNGSWSVAMMLLTGLNAPDALDHPIEPLAGGEPSRPDWLDVADAQLRWLAKMQRSDGAVHHKATTRDWPKLDDAPLEDEAVKWLMPVSSTATADFAATMALAAKAYRDLPNAADRDAAARFEAAAKRALDWLDANPDLVMVEARYGGKEYGGPYTDTSDSDERFFARAAWAALKRSPDALAAVNGLAPLRRDALRAKNDDTYWGAVDLFAFWALKSVEADLSPDTAAAVNAALRGAAHRWRVKQQRSPWLVPVGDGEGLPWGSNGMLATIGWHWMLWAKVSGDETYRKAGRTLVHWFHGRNPLGRTYVTGDAQGAVRDLHFRPSVSGAIPLPSGFLAGGPNSIDLAGDPAGGALVGLPPMRMHVDDKESYATNEVAINWQSAWALYASLLVDAAR